MAASMSTDIPGPESKGAAVVVDEEFVVRLRTLPAEPEGGEYMGAQWSQTLASFSLEIPVVPGVQKDDITIKVGTRSMEMHIFGEKKADFSKRFGGEVLPSRCAWFYSVADGELRQPAVVVLSLAKSEHLSWKGPYTQAPFLGTESFPWTKIMTEDTHKRYQPLTPLQEGEHLSADETRQLEAFSASDLVLGLDAYEPDPSTLCIEVHFEAIVAQKALTNFSWEELVGVDITKQSVVIFLHTDPNNPILDGRFVDEVAPEYTSWRLGTSTTWKYRQHPTGVAIPCLSITVFKANPSTWGSIFSQLVQHELCPENKFELQDLHRALEEDAVAQVTPGLPVLTEEEKLEIEMRIAGFKLQPFPGLANATGTTVVFPKGCYAECWEVAKVEAGEPQATAVS